ncbi:MAG: right-handed parallel beta-helix repeat-containing protein [Eubacteriales bacterium]
MKNVFDITEFGAVGDGKTDCTRSINAAMQAAGEVAGVVMVPPGEYLSGYIKMPERVSLIGYHAWSFRNDGASTIILNDPSAKCLLDITGAFGCTVKGVCLNGNHLGINIHGVFLEWENYNGGGQEDTPTLEDCRIGSFTGNGIHFKHIWCFSVRHCMTCHNNGHGLYIDGWDGFIIDNWMSGNRGAGMCGDICTASMTATGNRVEWNALAGFYLHNANSINITGNYFDRSGGPAINLANNENQKSNDITITGNVIYRSGKPRQAPYESEYESSHIWLNRCINTVITGNTMHIGQDDGGKGIPGPEYGIVYKRLKSSIIKDNTMCCGSFKKNLVDLGNHADGVIVKDNVGKEATDREHFRPDF